MAIGWMAGVVLFAAGLSAQSQQTAAAPAGQPAQGYRIAGVVVNSLTNEPIAGVSVAIGPATNVNGDITNTVTTGADGHFVFAGLGRGKYSLMGMARGFRLQYFEEHGSYSSAIAVGPEIDSEHLVFRLRPDASIEGLVLDENNDVVQNATVRLFEKGIADGRVSPVNQEQTNDQGRFRFGHLPSGTYYLAVSARPWYAQNDRSALRTRQDNSESNVQEMSALDVTYPLTFFPDSPDSAGASPIVLHPGESSTADVLMHAVPALHLRIRTGSTNTATSFAAGGMAFPRLSQRLFDGYLESTFNSPVSQVEPGVVEIMALAPGHYVIEMSPSNFGGRHRQGLMSKGPDSGQSPPSSATADSAPSRGWYQEIDLAGDAELNAGDSPGFATVSGSVSVEGEMTVPRNASIRLSNPTTGEDFVAPISERGQFDFTADTVRPGRYNVMLNIPQAFFLKRLSVTGARVTGRTIEISSAGSVHILCVAARGIGQVDGVALRDGQPFAGAMVVLVPYDPANNLSLFRRDQSDSDGTFTLPNVVPGQYTVIAIAEGWNLEWATPGVLQPYLKNGEALQVLADSKLQVKVQVQ